MPECQGTLNLADNTLPQDSRQWPHSNFANMENHNNCIHPTWLNLSEEQAKRMAPNDPGFPTNKIYAESSCTLPDGKNITKIHKELIERFRVGVPNMYTPYCFL